MVDGHCEDETDPACCRICFEDGTLDGLVAPCKCKGTQRFVHTKCLRRWQETVGLDKYGLTRRDAVRPAAARRHLRLKCCPPGLNTTMEPPARAACCSVCRTPFSLKPSSLPLRTQAGQHLATVVYLLVAGWLSLCLEGGAWRRWVLGGAVALAAMRLQMVGLLALMLWAMLPLLMHSAGFRTVLQLDPRGWPALLLVHHGAPVPGIGPGTLLVAASQLDGSSFGHSVVAITSHGPQGTIGVVLSRPMGGYQLLGPGELQGQASWSRPTVRHFQGGPVGQRGLAEADGVQFRVLHSLQVPGARPLFDADPLAEGFTGATPILRHGGHMPDVLAAADRQAPASPPGELGGWEGYVGGAAPQHTEAIVHIHWGICTWVPGQLDGELRHGAWKYGPGRSSDIIGQDPGRLWGHLSQLPHRFRALHP